MQRSTIAVWVGLAGAALACAWALGGSSGHSAIAECQDSRHFERQVRELEEDKRALQREVRVLRANAARKAALDEAPWDAAPRTEDGADDMEVPRPAPHEAPLAVGPGLRPHAPPLTVEQRRLLTLRNHGELIREMDLDERTTEALVGVLAGHEERAQAAFMDMGPVAADPREAAEMRDTFDELRARRHDEMLEAIGAQQTQRFETLEKTVPTRIELKQVREHLEAAGVPMGEEQREKLLALMTQGDDVEPPRPAENESMDEAFAKFREWRSERRRQLREHAGAILTSAQLRQLEAYAALNEAMEEAPPRPVATSPSPE